VEHLTTIYGPDISTWKALALYSMVALYQYLSGTDNRQLILEVSVDIVGKYEIFIILLSVQLYSSRSYAFSIHQFIRSLS